MTLHNAGMDIDREWSGEGVRTVNAMIFLSYLEMV